MKPGWYPLNANPNYEIYWDGNAWIQSTVRSKASFQPNIVFPQQSSGFECPKCGSFDNQSLINPATGQSAFLQVCCAILTLGISLLITVPLGLMQSKDDGKVIHICNNCGNKFF